MPEQQAGGEIAELYDRENDVYYVTFKTGEPSYCVEVNDVLVLEVGLFSNLPTGFRVLNMSKHETRTVALSEAKKYLEQVMRDLAVPSLNDRQASVGRALEKVLA